MRIIHEQVGAMPRSAHIALAAQGWRVDFTATVREDDAEISDVRLRWLGSVRPLDLAEPTQARVAGWLRVYLTETCYRGRTRAQQIARGIVPTSQPDRWQQGTAWRRTDVPDDYLPPSDGKPVRQRGKPLRNRE